MRYSLWTLYRSSRSLALILNCKCIVMLWSYVPLTLCPRKGSRDIWDIFHIRDIWDTYILPKRVIRNMRSLMAPRSVHFGVRSRKLSNVGQSWDGWLKMYYVELLRASEGTLSRWSRLHLQSLAPTNPHWARVVGYDLFSLCVIHKEGLCPSNGWH
jgi:hypothetical protein